MNDALQPFLREHDQIRSMLVCFDAQLTVFEKAERPDYEVLSESLAYCKDYLDVWHHPREDRLLDLLRARNRAKAAAMSALGEQHRDLAEATTQVIGIFNDVAQRGAIRLRETLVRGGRELSAAYRRHLDWEEAHFFPVAVEVLELSDWEVMRSEAADAAAAVDPGRVRARYPALFGAIETIA